VKCLLAACILFFATKSHAQWSLALQKDTQLVVASLSVDVPVDDKGNVTRKIAGSGFLYSSEHWVYFVTAKHVIAAVLPPGGRKTFLRTHIKGDLPDVPSDYAIEMSTALINRGLYLSNRDIAIIRLGRFDGSFISQPYVNAIPLSSKDLGNKVLSRMVMTVDKTKIMSFDDVDVTEDVIVFGFPESLDQYPDIVPTLYESTWPLFRKGIVSGKNSATHQIVIDVPVFPGNSGGPVMLVRPNGFSKTTSLIGIAVEYIPYVSKSRDERGLVTSVNISSSGYTIVEPMDSFLELVSSVEK
jgi:hypothetical protein